MTLLVGIYGSVLKVEAGYTLQSLSISCEVSFFLKPKRASEVTHKINVSGCFLAFCSTQFLTIWTRTVRITVTSVEVCHLALALIHSLLHPVKYPLLACMNITNLTLIEDLAQALISI